MVILKCNRRSISSAKRHSTAFRQRVLFFLPGRFDI
jgi:hypothetical protein